MSEEVNSINFSTSYTNSSVVAHSPIRQIQELALVALLSILIIVIVMGNTLVILAILTTRRLRTVTNCFVLSLSVADWLVAVFVMPPAVAYHLMGSWELGWLLCEIWVYLDILLCTASILSLCAISVDRYLAVTQPLSYSRKRRSKRLAFGMIVVVWVSSALITCPPMFGWYEPGRHKNKTCRYNRNTGYVIYSAMGSFFIPMVVMLYVYLRISCVIARRHNHLAQIDTRTMKSQKLVGSKEESETERGSSEDENVIKCTSLCSDQIKSIKEKQKLASHNSSKKPLRVSYSASPDAHIPARVASFYSTSSMHHGRSRPSSMNYELATTINMETTGRVSSIRRETKTAQTLSIVVGGFIVCWLPFFIYYLLTPFLPSSMVNKSVVMAYLTWLGWINSAINPFIYAFYAPDFRLAFWRLTCRHFSKQRRADILVQHK